MLNWNISNPIFESDILNEKLNVSPWSGHRRFVYDLLRFIRPEHVLELGTHYGCSFFAMCQAIKDFKISTTIEAVDTWVGDSQAGFYGEEVYSLVNKTIDNYFLEIETRMHRMTFDEANPYFVDDYFDIIHIDGFHEYDAVKNDYLSYLPKLKKNGIFLFHDIASDTGYGSSVFWKELQERYSSFEFEHSWGLGVLFPKGDKYYNLMIDENIFDKILYYTSKSELDLATIKVNDLEVLGIERFETINQMEGMIQERDEVIASQNMMLDERYKAMQEMEGMIQERDEVIASQNVMLDERYEAMQEMEGMIQERDKVIASQNVMLDKRYEAMQEMEGMIQERDTTIALQNEILEKKGGRKRGWM
ncbi:class I SAM-dependent methyltransferase [Paenibacillus enshidis]|uniref:Class I SAM-dependent methyltransferase n=1 Tax=Paenibacillus enshidis TaxID=1458439 RepID=A0ABV5AR56_9BACL